MILTAKILAIYQELCESQEVHHIEAKKAIKVSELPSENKPCGFIGKGKKSKNYTKTGVWLRGANNDYEATVQELKPLMLAQAGVSYEQVILDGTTLDDIDPKHLERYRRLRGAIKPNASELEYSDSELLLALDVAIEKAGHIYPNIAGLLLFGSDRALRRLMPMARVDYIRHAGTVWVEGNDQRFLYTNDLREAIITMIPKLEANIIDDLPKRFELPPNALQRIDTPILPQEVVREAVVNMLMHRDYAVHQPSQINRFSDRIELTNAGYSLKPVEKIRDGVKGSQLRNPIIAQVLYDLNFAETKGSGIATMNNGLKDAGLNPVVFTTSRQHNESETVLRLQQFIDETDMTWLQQFSGVKDNEAEVLILAKQMPRITNKDIRKNVGIDMHQASTILKKFCKRGYFSKHGKSQNSYYILNDQYLTGISEPSMGGIEPSMGGIEPSMGGIEEVIADLSVLDNANSQLLLNRSLLARQKRKLTNTAMKIILLNLMDNHTITPKVLADLLDRNAEFLRKNYLNPMVKEGLIQLFYPNNIKHPNQAYRTTSKGTAWLNAQTDKKPIN